MAAPVCQLSDMEWRKRSAGDPTARPDEEEVCIPCENAAKRGVEIEYAIGMRDESSSGNRAEIAVARLREALTRTATQAPEKAAEELLDALGQAYMAGVELEDPWMKAAAARVAASEAS